MLGVVTKYYICFMKLKLKTIPPAPPAPIYKASIHKTGKIGFTIETAKHFGITAEKSMELAINEEDPTDLNVYGIIRPPDDPNAYKIQKAGDYHSVNAKGFFESIKLDYVNTNINYTVSEINVDGTPVLKFEVVKKESDGGRVMI